MSGDCGEDAACVVTLMCVSWCKWSDARGDAIVRGSSVCVFSIPDDRVSVYSSRYIAHVYGALTPRRTRAVPHRHTTHCNALTAGGSPVPNPGDGLPFNRSLSYGGVCEPGGWCGNASTTPMGTLCTAGTYQPLFGARNASACVRCEPSTYCATSGLTTAAGSGPCAPGSFCNGGATNASQWPAPPGYYTLAGASAPTPCAPGTWNNMSSASACRPALLGTIAPFAAMVTPLPAPAGTYADTVGLTSAVSCPAGTVQPLLGATNASACTPVAPGLYAASAGLAAASGPCSEGFYCTGVCARVC